MADVPVLFSLVAVIVAEPAPAAVTRPLPSTLATDLLEVAHVTVRPVRVPPPASFGVAVSWTVWLTSTLADGGATLTETTATLLTVMTDVALCPPADAVIVARPAATPVTSPVPSTVATAVLPLDQVTATDTGLPTLSFGVAVRGVFSPTGTVSAAGVRTTETTVAGQVTATLAVPVTLLG